jgi:hypothetical protein
VSGQPLGFAGAICEVGQLLRVPLCGSEALPKVFARSLGTRVPKIEGQLRAAEGTTKARKQDRILSRAEAGLGAIEVKTDAFVRRGKIAPVCGQTIHAKVDRRRALVSGLMTP